jgi:hypothetical protein
MYFDRLELTVSSLGPGRNEAGWFQRFVIHRLCGESMGTRGPGLKSPLLVMRAGSFVMRAI